MHQFSNFVITSLAYELYALLAFRFERWQNKDNMKWIKLRDRMPLQNIDGEKVLVCRILNEGQASQNPTILPTNKIHLCDTNETWWMALPELPSALANER